MVQVKKAAAQILDNPRWLTMIFSSTEYAWIWLIIRLYVGITWVTAGWGKIFEEAWFGNGYALKSFWSRAVVVPENGSGPIAYNWYRWLLEFMLDHRMYVWFGKLVVLGETAIGIGLIIGAFTGIAAFFGATLSWSFMLAGTASTNPVLGILGVSLVIAWKVAGWWGADRFILPTVGAPWQRGPLLGGNRFTIIGEDAEARRAAIEEWAWIAVGGATVAVAFAYLQGWAQVTTGLVGGLVLAGSWLLPFHFLPLKTGRKEPAKGPRGLQQT